MQHVYRKVCKSYEFDCTHTHIHMHMNSVYCDRPRVSCQPTGVSYSCETLIFVD